jgi:tetratricopeptide (TPR) repeat protein
MTAKDFFEENKVPLNEGLVILKNSKRINKLVDQIEKKMKSVNAPTGSDKIINRLKSVAKDFEKVEKQYKEGDKKQAREKYNELIIKYKPIVEEINKESFKKALIAAGIVIVVTLVSLITIRIINFGKEVEGLETKAKKLEKEIGGYKKETEGYKKEIDTMKQTVDVYGVSNYDKATKEQKVIIDEFITRIAKKEGIPENILRAVIRVESQGRKYPYNLRNKDRSMDVGIMQLNSKYTKYYRDKYWHGQEFEPMDPFQSITTGAKILVDLYKEWGNWDKAIQAYNVGSTALKTGQKVDEAKKYLKMVKEMMNMFNVKKG